MEQFNKAVKASKHPDPVVFSHEELLSGVSTAYFSRD